MGDICASWWGVFVFLFVWFWFWVVFKERGKEHKVGWVGNWGGSRRNWWKGKMSSKYIVKKKRIVFNTES